MINEDLLQPPPSREESRTIELLKGPNIASLPDFEGVLDRLELPVLLKVGDGISTDEIRADTSGHSIKLRHDLSPRQAE